MQRYNRILVQQHECYRNGPSTGSELIPYSPGSFCVISVSITPPAVLSEAKVRYFFLSSTGGRVNCNQFRYAE